MGSSFVMSIVLLPRSPSFYNLTIKTLLVAVDLSPISSQIIKATEPFAKSLGAKVILLHVLQPINTSVPIGSAMDVVALPLPFTKEEITEISAKLEKTAKPLKEAGIDVELILKEALPVEEIKHQAKKNNVEFIIIGSHGHGGLYHLFNGSVITTLLKETTKPVLVIPIRVK
jgi:nucleotide-binding universal stress UspA family protein